MVRWRSCRLDDLHALFQALLLAGYAYAHLSAHYLKPRIQAHVSYGLALCGASDVAYHTWRRLETGSLSESDLAEYWSC